MQDLHPDEIGKREAEDLRHDLGYLDVKVERYGSNGPDWPGPIVIKGFRIMGDEGLVWTGFRTQMGVDGRLYPDRNGWKLSLSVQGGFVWRIP